MSHFMTKGTMKKTVMTTNKHLREIKNIVIISNETKETRVYTLCSTRFHHKILESAVNSR
jgi:hypothetical protein